MRGLILGLVAALLAGCATSEQAALQDDATCAAWGAAAGSAPYAECRTALAQKRAADQAAFAQRLAAAGRAMSAASPASPVQPARSSAMFDHNAPPVRTGCFKRGEQVSGMNKLCLYDCLGSAHVVTQNAVSMCPLMVQQ